MKNIQRPPVLICVVCVLLAMVFWFVFIVRVDHFARTPIDDFAKTLYVLFLPLTSTPYILWVVHKEGQEPGGYFKDAYAGHAGFMWFIRVFMMGVASGLSSVAAFVVLGTFGLVFYLFKYMF